jgi:hypothetical protein
MVKSNKIYSPQTYLEAITGKCFIIREDDDIIAIETILSDMGYGFWNYSLSEIDHIVENDINVVLVECAYWNETMHELEHVARWFEVPEDFEEE